MVYMMKTNTLTDTITNFWNDIDPCRVNPSQNVGYEDEYIVAVENTIYAIENNIPIAEMVTDICHYYWGEELDDDETNKINIIITKLTNALNEIN